jgi:RNA polymerase sigma factor (sigma-70 family)
MEANDIGLNDMRIDDIILEYRSQLLAFIRKRVNSLEDAEDILQDVFYQLARAEYIHSPVEYVSGWLYKTARNKIIDWWRRRKTNPVPDGSELVDAELATSNMAAPEYEYFNAILWKELETALNELPENQKEVFEQTEFGGRSFKEISSETGIPVNTLISRKHYAVVHLRERLKWVYEMFGED